MRTRTDGMRARLARAEKLAGKGPCAGCRFMNRHAWPGAAKSRPGSEDAPPVVASRCEFCGTPWEHDLSRYPEELREVARLYYASNLEDLYTDPRAWAARRWMSYWAEARSQDRRAMRDGPGPSTQAPPLRGRHGYGRQQEALERDPDVRRYLRLLAQAKALLDRRLGQLERRHGKNPFPEIESRVAAIVGPDLSQMSPSEKLAHARETLMSPAPRVGGPWLLCAEMERVVLGGVSAYTSRMLADGERRAREADARLEALMEEGRVRLQQLERESPPAPPPEPPPPQESQMDRPTVARSQNPSRRGATGPWPREQWRRPRRVT